MSNLSKRQLRSGSKISRKRNYRAPQKIGPLRGGRNPFEVLDRSPGLDAQPDNELKKKKTRNKNSNNEPAPGGRNEPAVQAEEVVPVEPPPTPQEGNNKSGFEPNNINPLTPPAEEGAPSEEGAPPAGEEAQEEPAAPAAGEEAQEEPAAEEEGAPSEEGAPPAGEEAQEEPAAPAAEEVEPAAEEAQEEPAAEEEGAPATEAVLPAEPAAEEEGAPATEAVLPAELAVQAEEEGAPVGEEAPAAPPAQEAANERPEGGNKRPEGTNPHPFTPTVPPETFKFADANQQNIIVEHKSGEIVVKLYDIISYELQSYDKVPSLISGFNKDEATGLVKTISTFIYYNDKMARFNVKPDFYQNGELRIVNEDEYENFDRNTIKELLKKKRELERESLEQIYGTTKFGKEQDFGARPGSSPVNLFTNNDYSESLPNTDNDPNKDIDNNLEEQQTHIQQLIDSSTELKKHYEQKHEEVILLGHIITAMKHEFNRLAATKTSESESRAALKKLRRDIQTQKTKNIHEIVRAINAIDQDLDAHIIGQSHVLGEASQRMDNLANYKRTSGHSASNTKRISQLARQAEDLSKYPSGVQSDIQGRPPPATAQGMASTRKSLKKKPAKKPRKKSGHRRSKGKRGSRVSNKGMIKLTRRRGNQESNA